MGKLQNSCVCITARQEQVQVTDEIRTSKNCKVTGTYRVTEVEVGLRWGAAVREDPGAPKTAGKRRPKAGALGPGRAEVKVGAPARSPHWCFPSGVRGRGTTR